MMTVLACLAGFQSTHPRGVRRKNTLNIWPPVMFQSTHPRGVRHTDMYLYGLECRFQSTHPRGVRPY